MWSGLPALETTLAQKRGLSSEKQKEQQWSRLGFQRAPARMCGTSRPPDGGGFRPGVGPGPRAIRAAVCRRAVSRSAMSRTGAASRRDAGERARSLAAGRCSGPIRALGARCEVFSRGRPWAARGGPVVPTGARAEGVGWVRSPAGRGRRVFRGGSRGQKSPPGRPSSATIRHKSAMAKRTCVILKVVEGKGFEPSTSALRTPRSPN